MTQTIRDISTIRLRARADQYAADSLEARNVQAALEAENMTWAAEFKPVFTENADAFAGLNQIAGWRALCRSDNGAAVGMHKGAYTVLQQHEAFAGLQPLLDAGEARITRCGQLQGGAKVFVEATLERATGEVALGDVVRTKLVFSNSHDGTTKASVSYFEERLRCFNGMTSLATSVLCSGRHTSGIRAEMAEWRAEFERVRAGQAKRIATWRGFTRRRMNEAALRAYIREVLSPGAGTDQDVVVRNVDRIMEINETAPGADPGTLWGAVNAVTYWGTHERGRSDDARTTAVMFGEGGALLERATTVATVVAESLPMIELARQSYANHATAKSEFDALLGRAARISVEPSDLA